MKITDFLSFKKANTVLIILLVTLGCGLTTYGNYLLTPMANEVKNANGGKFVLYLTLMLAMVIMSYMLKYVAQYLYSKYEQKYIHSLREKITGNYYSDFGDNHSVSEMQNSLTNDLNILTETVLDPLFKIVSFVLDIVFSVAVVLTFNIYLLGLILFLAVLLLLLPKLISRPLQVLTNNVSKKNQFYIDLIQKWLSGLAVLQRYHAKNKLLSVLSGGALSLESSKVNKDKATARVSILSASLNMTAQALVLLVTGLLIVNGRLTFGVFFSIGNFASLIFSELVVLNENVTLIQSAKELNKKVTQELVHSKSNSKSSYNDNMEDFASLDIIGLEKKFLNGESLKYQNIHINAGEKILLSGDSGTGKSTLFKLILREIMPTSGEIIFKNKSGKEIYPRLTQIGYIPQDPVLFPGSIEENITMFNSQLNSQAQNWAKKMQLADDLDKFPDGIKTQIDLETDNLSGGQRQKVVLARTKVYQSKLILIDEGTSAIDEKATLSILKHLLEGPETIIFIAHNWAPKLHNMFDKEIVLKPQ